MSQFSIGRLNELDTGFVLAPERYDPRKRTADVGVSGAKHRVIDLVTFRKETVSRETADSTAEFLIFDTSHAREGVLTVPGPEVNRSSIGSTKKVFYPGDVLISRLRPYLRQVAYVDERICSPELKLLCSTEFYVLSPARSDASIAYLVPFLLSHTVQTILAAAQEGGHHPRFADRVLQNLPVPDMLVDRKDIFSDRVRNVIDTTRSMERVFRDVKAEVNMWVESLA